MLLILALIAGVLIAWRIFFQKEPLPGPLPTPTPVSQLPLPTPTKEVKGRGDTPEQLLRSLKERFPLIEFVPFETENFRLDYQAPLHLEVVIKKPTQSAQIKEEVRNWLWKQGVNPATHKIDWVTPGL